MHDQPKSSLWDRENIRPIESIKTAVAAWPAASAKYSDMSAPSPFPPSFRPSLPMGMKKGFVKLDRYITQPSNRLSIAFIFFLWSLLRTFHFGSSVCCLLQVPSRNSAVATKERGRAKSYGSRENWTLQFGIGRCQANDTRARHNNRTRSPLVNISCGICGFAECSISAAIRADKYHMKAAESGEPNLPCIQHVTPAGLRGCRQNKLCHSAAG